MNRRAFLKTMVGAAVASALPLPDGYSHKTFSIGAVTDMELAESNAALARSMMQTRVVTCANVLNRGFRDALEPGLNKIFDEAYNGGSDEHGQS